MGYLAYWPCIVCAVDWAFHGGFDHEFNRADYGELSLWCRPCRSDDHQGHRPDFGGQCILDNQFNSDCRCPRGRAAGAARSTGAIETKPDGGESSGREGR